MTVSIETKEDAVVAGRQTNLVSHVWIVQILPFENSFYPEMIFFERNLVPSLQMCVDKRNLWWDLLQYNRMTLCAIRGMVSSAGRRSQYFARCRGGKKLRRHGYNSSQGILGHRRRRRMLEWGSRRPIPRVHGWVNRESIFGQWPPPMWCAMVAATATINRVQVHHHDSFVQHIPFYWLHFKSPIGLM